MVIVFFHTINFFHLHIHKAILKDDGCSPYLYYEETSKSSALAARICDVVTLWGEPVHTASERYYQIVYKISFLAVVLFA